MLGWAVECHLAAIAAWEECVTGKERVLVIDISGTRATDLLQRLGNLPAFVHWYMCEVNPDQCSIRNKGEPDFRYVLQAILAASGHEGVPYNADISLALAGEAKHLDLYDHIHFILDPNSLVEIYGFRALVQTKLFDPFRSKMSIEVCTYDRPRPAIEPARRVAKEILGPSYQMIGPQIQMLRRITPIGARRWRQFFKHTSS